MAWVTKANIDSKKPLIKALNKEYGIKATLSGTNDYTMTLTVSEGPIDFINSYIKSHDDKPMAQPSAWEHTVKYIMEHQYIDVNPYWYNEHFDGKALEYLRKAHEIMNQGNHDRSDIQTDYFDVGWYVDVKIGRWNKPYKLSK